MDISTNNALTAISYGAAAVTVTMAAANVVLVGTGAGAKAGAFVADYFKNESVAQNLRIKGDQLISLAGKYAATELKVAAALVAVGGSVALAQYSQDNANPCDKNDDICNKVQSYEKLGMCFDKNVNLTKYAKETDEIAKQVSDPAQDDTSTRAADEKLVRDPAQDGLKTRTKVQPYKGPKGFKGMKGIQVQRSKDTKVQDFKGTDGQLDPAMQNILDIIKQK